MPVSNGAWTNMIDQRIGRNRRVNGLFDPKRGGIHSIILVGAGDGEGTPLDYTQGAMGDTALRFVKRDQPILAIGPLICTKHQQ